MEHTSARKSAAPLTWGLVLLVLGPVIWVLGASQPEVNEPLILLGGIVSVVGTVGLIIGVHALASNVDRLAQLAAGPEVPKVTPTVSSRPPLRLSDDYS